MHTLTSLQADIDSLHSKCNELRQSLGHPTTLESEARALVKDGGSRPGTEQALLQLRESKASELQMLSLRCCGRSTRDCHGAVTGPSGSRFNLKLLLAVADCMSTQGKELAEQTKRHEALQRENRALRDLTGQRSAAEGGSSQPLGGPDAFPASPVPSAAAPVRPSSAMAAVRRQPPPVPSDGRPSPHEAFAELFGSSSSSVSASASVSGNVSGSGSGSSGSGSSQPSGISRQPPPQPYAPPALALQRPPPPSTAAMRQPDAPSHRAPPALRRDASGLSLTAAAAATAAAANASDAAAAAALTAEASARASANGSRELRLLSLQRRLDESLAENAMWKRQFAKRLEEMLAQYGAGGAAAQVPTAALAQAAPSAKAPNTAPPPVKPPPAAAPGPAPPNTAPAPKAHLQPSKGAQDGAPDGAAAAVASATAADALAASEAEAERLRTELQAALVRARAAETGRDAEKQRTARLDAELKEAHASLEKAKASADASAKQRSAGEADAAKAAASKAQGAAAQAAAQAESRAQQLEQRAEKVASQLAALHAEHAAVAAKAKAEMSADLCATRESLATVERELSEARRAAERAEARASKAEKEAERVVAEARRARDGALANAQAQASDDL